MIRTCWVMVLPFWAMYSSSRYDGMSAKAAGVPQVTLLATEEGELEVADRDVGDDRDFGAQATLGLL